MNDRGFARNTLNYGLIALGCVGFFGCIIVSLTAFGAMSRGENARIQWMFSGILLLLSIGCWIAASVYEKQRQQPDGQNPLHGLPEACPMCGSSLSRSVCDNCGERISEYEATTD